ncbi:hypothetical protein KKE34_03620 [Patescibacteria group bacterium]|nr:hypothetical protein [Patescibacteria group bacterium]MBU1885669.1 hypothetical protein [Patescibacteria group bacterium]
MNNQSKNGKGMQLNVNAGSTPILYTDNIFMSTNHDGLVLDIVQRVGSSDQGQIVSRIGMSREHAKKFVEKLAQLLVKTEGQMVTGKDKIIN